MNIVRKMSEIPKANRETGAEFQTEYARLKVTDKMKNGMQMNGSVDTGSLNKTNRTFIGNAILLK